MTTPAPLKPSHVAPALQAVTAMRPAAELVVGRVLHERLRPQTHRFSYPVFSVRIDLARIGEAVSQSRGWFGLQAWRPLSLSWHDHGARDGSDPLVWMRGVLADAGLPHDGQVVLQAFPRVFGWGFKPVSFWYCHNRAGALVALYAEVNNTFGEHHGYLLAEAGGGPIGPDTVLACRKRFYVSPFCAVDGDYTFRLRARLGFVGVAIDHFDAEGLLLHTAVGGRVLRWSATELVRVLLRMPAQGLGIVARIHWQALRLWLRRVPLFARPPAPQQAIDVSIQTPTTPPPFYPPRQEAAP